MKPNDNQPILFQKQNKKNKMELPICYFVRLCDSSTMNAIQTGIASDRSFCLIVFRSNFSL